MNRNWLVAAVLAALLVACTTAEKKLSDPIYEPVSGQAGKDVVWVPTPQALVDKMLDMAQVTAKDTVIDLGSGDGRTVVTAARRGATALGIEYNPDMVELSRRNAQRNGVTGKATFVKADLFEADLSQATVITMFLLPSINLKLRPKILALKPGTRVVSNSFTMDTWEPDQSHTVSRPACDSGFCTAHLWIVPAQFGGTHKLPQGELVLEQKFQVLSGRLTTGLATHKVAGTVRGEQAFFKAGDRAYSARLSGGKLTLF